MELSSFLLYILPILLILSLFFGIVLGKSIEKFRREKDFQERLRFEREDAIKRSRSVLSGQFSEQIAPYLPNFPGKASECRFIGKPFDFLLLKGLDEKEIEEIVFVEVKSGKSQLSGVERSLKRAIEEKKVRYEIYRVKEEKED